MPVARAAKCARARRAAQCPIRRTARAQILGALAEQAGELDCIAMFARTRALVRVEQRLDELRLLFFLAESLGNRELLLRFLAQAHAHKKLPELVVGAG